MHLQGFFKAPSRAGRKACIPSLIHSGTGMLEDNMPTPLVDGIAVAIHNKKGYLSKW